MGKEEIVGLTRAIEIYLKKDHEAEWRDWEARVAHIVSRVSGIQGVRAERFVPEIANEAPHAAIEWDETRSSLTRDSFAQALREDELLVEVRIPAWAAGTGGCYMKFPHPASRFAVVGVGAVVTLDRR